ISASEFIGKLRMMRSAADDLGREDFVIIARTDGVSATAAPESKRGLELAIDRGLRYLDSGVPDLLWCEFPTAERRPTEALFTGVPYHQHVGHVYGATRLSEDIDEGLEISKVV